MQIAQQLTIHSFARIALWSRCTLLHRYSGAYARQLNSRQPDSTHSLCIAGDIQGAPLGVAQCLRVHARG